MLINLDNLATNSNTLQDLSATLLRSGQLLYPVISSAFSTITGVSEVGGIHARAIAGDPASAADQLKNLGQRIESMAVLLYENAQLFQAQEEANTKGLSMADAGGKIESVEVTFTPLTELPANPLVATPPIVSVGASLRLLDTALKTTNISHLTATATQWRDIATTLSEVITTLDTVAHDLETTGLCRVL